MRRLGIVLLLAPFAVLPACGDDGAAGGSGGEGGRDTTTGTTKATTGTMGSTTSTMATTTTGMSTTTGMTTTTGMNVCGDGNQGGNEECDDGNLVDGDGCDSNCTATGCGNMIVTAPEACDDGNMTNGDGCDNNCTVSGCGNGIQRGMEACDDGNLVDGDGCDSNCTVTACGNSITTAPETCDDANTNDTDGCTNDCTNCAHSICSQGEALDPTCNACAATICAMGNDPFCCDAVNGAWDAICVNQVATDCMLPACPDVCGDNWVSVNEECDDGNTVDGDGCQADCTALCGDGIVVGGPAGNEDCDDGNATEGDGCDSNCTVSACGNGICAPGEDSCNCADCPDDPNTCSACQCGDNGGNCFCDPACVFVGDCCTNETAQCGSQPYTFTFSNGTDTPIPAGTYNGTLASMACVTLASGAVGGNIVSVNNVTVSMSHTWMGDAVIKLVSPQGTVITLVSRPGLAETGDDGTGCCGTSDDAVQTGLLQFVQGAATSAETMGASAGTFVCAAGQTCVFNPDNGSAPAGNFTNLVGQPAAGNWQLCVGDAVIADTGTIFDVSINLTID